jgi:hypothetical protein
LWAKPSLESGRFWGQNIWKARLFAKTGVQKEQLCVLGFAIYSPFFRAFGKAVSTSGCKLLPFRDHFLAFSVDTGKAMS